MPCGSCGKQLTSLEYAAHVKVDERPTPNGSEVRCRFCHQWVTFRRIREHEHAHMQRGPDGQQESHLTVPPENRFRGSLEGIPIHYRHQKCGQTTTMPEDIVRSYLANPFLYDDTSFCSGCGDYVHIGTLQWLDTGETLLVHDRRLKAEYLKRYGLPPCAP